MNTSVHFTLWICDLILFQRQSMEGRREFSLWRVLSKAFLGVWMIGGLCKIASDMLLFVGPMALDGIVTYVTEVKVEGHQNATLPEVRFICLRFHNYQIQIVEPWCFKDTAVCGYVRFVSVWIHTDVRGLQCLGSNQSFSLCWCNMLRFAVGWLPISS